MKKTKKCKQSKRKNSLNNTDNVNIICCIRGHYWHDYQETLYKRWEDEPAKALEETATLLYLEEDFNDIQQRILDLLNNTYDTPEKYADTCAAIFDITMLLYTLYLDNSRRENLIKIGNFLDKYGYCLLHNERMPGGSSNEK